MLLLMDGMKMVAEMLLLPPFCCRSISVFSRKTPGDEKDRMISDPNQETPETTARDLGTLSGSKESPSLGFLAFKAILTLIDQLICI